MSQELKIPPSQKAVLTRLVGGLKKPPLAPDRILHLNPQAVTQLPAVAITQFLMNAPQDYCLMATQTMAREIVNGLQHPNGLVMEVLAMHVVQGGLVNESPRQHVMMWRNIVTTMLDAPNEKVAAIGADLEGAVEDQALREIELSWNISNMSAEQIRYGAKCAAFIGHLFAVEFFVLPDVWDAIFSLLQFASPEKVATTIWCIYELVDAIDGERIEEDVLELRGFCIRFQMAIHQYELTYFVEGADSQAVIDATATCGEIRAVIDKWMSIAQDDSGS